MVVPSFYPAIFGLIWPCRARLDPIVPCQFARVVYRDAPLAGGQRSRGRRVGAVHGVAEPVAPGAGWAGAASSWGAVYSPGLPALFPMTWGMDELRCGVLCGGGGRWPQVFLVVLGGSLAVAFSPLVTHALVRAAMRQTP